MKESKKTEEKRLTARTLIEYAPQIFPHIPKLMGRMDITQWTNVLHIVSNKHLKSSVGVRGKTVVPFIDDFMEFLANSGINLMEYSIDELSRVEKEAYEENEWCSVNLERIILDSVQQRTSQFSKEELSRMHGILLRLYKKGKPLGGSFASFFNEFADNMKEVPESYRLIVLEGAEKLLSERLRKGKRTKGEVLISYSEFSRDRVAVLRKSFRRFLEKTVRSSRNLDELAECLEDEHRYFERYIERVAGGLSLSQIHGRLSSYMQALTGNPVKIESSQTSELQCSFNGESFFLPQVINICRDNEENFGIYKALASYQAGTIMFGTYSHRNLQEFFDSFANPEFAKSLFEVMEFTRLDSRLNEEFPGLRKDLRTFKDAYRNQQEKNGKSILSRIRTYVCQENEEDCLVLGKLKPVVFPEVGELRKKGSKPEKTIESVERIYRKLEKSKDLSKERPLEKIIDTEEVIFVERSEKKKVPSYLVATPIKKTPTGSRFRYDEWDSTTESYKPGFVQVIEMHYPDIRDNSYVKELLQSDHSTIQKIKYIFDILKPEDFMKVKKQRSGDLNYDLWVRALAEQSAGITPSQKLFIKRLKNQRSVASMILSENSGSLRKFLDIDNPDLRLIDIIKKSQVYFSEALDAIGDNFALATFSGETEQNVNFHVLKDFDSTYDAVAKNAIGSIRPLQQNRDGAGIRHATYLLSQQPEKTRFLFYLMEGCPHDFNYEGEYAIEDTKRAIVESKYKGCIPVVVAFGREISDRIRTLANHCVYREISDPRNVPNTLPNIYRKMAI